MADLRDLFNTESTQQDARAEFKSGISSKYDSLQQASQQKIQFLTDLKAQRQATEQANAESIVGQLGLNPNSDLGTLVNTGAASVAALTGDDSIVATNVHDFKPASIQRRAGDVAISALKSAIAVPDMAVGLASMVTGGAAGKLLTDAGFKPAEANAFLDALYSNEQRAANENVHGAEGFWQTMAEIADNPSTVPHNLLQSLFPMLAGGLAGRGLQALGAGLKASTALGEGAVMAGSAAEGIRRETEDGRLSLKQSLAAATTGLMGAAVSRLGMKAGEKMGLGDIDEAIVKGTLGQSKNGALINGVGSGALEAGEEALQSTGETILQNAALDRELTDGVGNAAAIGLVTGAAMGAPMGAAETAGAQATITKKANIEKAAIQAAIQTNDTASFLDEASESYSPVAAVSVLFGNSELPTATPEAKATNLQQAEQIVSDLDQKLQDKWGEYFTLEDAGKTDADTLKSMKLELGSQETVLNEARKVKEALAGSVTSAAEIRDLVSKANTPGAAKESVDQVINLAMKSTTAISAEEATQLADNTANALSNDQRTYLRMFAESRIAQNALKDMEKVSQEVYYGSPVGAEQRNIGIAQYEAKITEAISVSNLKRAQENVAGLVKFSEDHSAKAAAVNEAWDGFQNDAQPRQVIRDPKGNWSVVPGGTVSKKELKASGGLAIAANSVKLVPSIAAEADALNKSAATMKQAVQLKFGSPAAVTPAVQAPASPTPAASVPSSSSVQEKQDSTKREPAKIPNTAPAVEAPAEAAKAVEESTVDVSNIVLKEDYSTLNTPEDVLKFAKQAKNTLSQLTAKPGDDLTEDEYDLKVRLNKMFNQDNFAGFDWDMLFDGMKPTEAQRTALEKLIKDSPKVETKPVHSAPSPVVTSPAPLKDRTDEDSGSTLRSTETVEPTAAEAVQEENQTTGLNALAQKSEADTPYQRRNLLADYLVQAAHRDGDKSKRPLVAVKNFLGKWLGKEISFRDFMETPKNGFQQTHFNALRAFQKFAMKWDTNFSENLARREGISDKGNDQRDYWYADLMQFLTEGEGKNLTIEENIKTAMSLSAFSWIVEKASTGLSNSPEEINLILGRDETHAVSDTEMAKLAYIGTRQNVVANALGQKAIQALGLKAAKDAPADLMPRLEGAIGAHIMKMMLDQKILSRSSEISGYEMAQLMGNTLPTDQKTIDKLKNQKQQFITVVKDTDGNLNPQAQEIVESSRGSQGVLDKLFSVEPGLKFPSFEPIPFTQKTTKNTNQQVPEALAKVIEHENSVANYIRDDSMQLVGQISKEMFLAMAGAEEITENTHITKRKSIQAKRDALEREYDRLMEFYGSMEDKHAALYLDHSVWMQQRVGVATNVINPQASKIHRHLMYRKSWETEVSLADTDQMNNFRLRVAEGLGIKTDKQDSSKALEEFHKLAANPVITKAVAIVQKAIFEGGLTMDEQKALLEAVKAGKEDMHSFDALIALARYEEAKAKNADSFTVQLMGEVDGVTNGPMFSHLLLGAATNIDSLFELLNRGGFYREGDAHSQYNIWRGTPGHLDLYEITALHITQAVQAMAGNDKRMRSTLSAIYAFTGELTTDTGNVSKDGRNLVKTPLTAMVFGSALGSAVDSMTEKFMESIYGKIEKLDTDEKRIALIKNLNQLGAGLAENTSKADLLEHEFKGRQLHNIQQSFKDSLGKAVQDTMKQDFASFIEQRKKFNLAAQTTFELYNAVYTGVREAYIAELIAAGSIPVKSDGTPLHELTQAQEATLRKRLEKLEPVMHSAMSKQDGSLKAGLYMGKSARKLSQEPVYSGNIKFGKPFADNGAKTTTTHGYERQASNPGVAMVPVSTHSFDSGVMHSSIGDTEVLNVHDAKGVGLGGFQQAAHSLNQSVWSNMLAYSPATEVYEALVRTLTGIDVLMKSGNVPDSVIANLKKTITTMAAKQEIPAEQFLHSMLFDTKEMSFNADDMKLHALSLMGSIDQYALEGGNYAVSETERQEANAKRAELTREVTPALRDVVGRLSGIFGKAAESKPDQEAAVAPVKTSPFGKIGESVNGNDKDLSELLASKSVMSVQDVLQALVNRLRHSPDQDGKYKLYLAVLLQRTLENSKLSVTYVTANTKETDVVSLPTADSMGWYSNKEGKEGIYILGTEFVHSGISTEVLLHEILHGVLASNIYIEELAQNPNSDAYKLIQELKVLQSKATEYAMKNGLWEKYSGTALMEPTNPQAIHEFISWGMTNQVFQKEILEKISMQSKTSGLVSGIKEFINILVGIIFEGTDKSRQAKAVNGMTIIISNVSGLIGHAHQKNQANITLSQVSSAPLGYTTQALFDGLNAGSIDQLHANHLRGLLGSIVDKLHGPFGSFKQQFMENQVGTALDTFAKAINTGLAPFASLVQASGIKISSQELFVLEQVEATIQAALDDKIAPSRAAYRELAKLYREARETFKPTDFDDPADYDFIFKMEAVDGKTDHLARFAAMGLTHQKFNRMLRVPTKITPSGISKATNFSEWLQAIFDSILEMFNSRVTATYVGQQADIKLSNLVSQLVDLEAKRRNHLNQVAKHSYAAVADEKLANGLGVVATKLDQFGQSAYFKTHKNAFVRAAGSLGSVMIGGRQQLFLQGLSNMRDKLNAGAPGLAAGLLNDIKGANETLQLLLRSSKHRDKHTVHVKTQTGKFALGSFINEGEYLSLEQKASISAVLLRTGAHNLLGKFDMKELSHLLSDPVALDKAIADELAKLGNQPKYKHYYDYQAKILGYYRATEKSKGVMMMQNAGNIARLYGTAYAGQISEAEAKVAEESLNVLVTLYGLRYSNKTEVAKVLSVMAKENGRTDGGHGIEAVLSLHKELAKQSKERLFAGNETLMAHGHVSEIYNPHIDVLVADVATVGKDLLDQGYVMGGLVVQDVADPDQTQKAIYVMRDGSAQPLLTGIMAYQDLSSKGTGKHTGNLNQNTLAGTNNVQLVQHINGVKAAAIQSMFNPQPSFDPSLTKGNFASPVMNSKGEVTNWRYLMQKRTKDNILERDNQFEKILGQLAGSIYDKETVTENNVKAIKALKEIYQKDFALNPDSYINVGPNSPDMEMREIHRLLPHATRQAIEDVWGRSGMMVRKDSLDLVFGYHKLSLSKMFDKLDSDRNHFEHAVTFAVEFAMETYVMGLNRVRQGKGLAPHDPKKYVRRAAMLVRKNERIWQAIVKEMKDIIVVKTGTVMVANVMSNFLLLKMYGVPLDEMVKNSLIAARGAREYHRDSDKLFQLETQVESGFVTGNKAEVEREITRLKDALARNPVRELIDAGLMPTIAEDIEATADEYSFKSALVRKTENFTNKLNPEVVKAAKTIYMSRDSTLYKALSETTQLSDFVARYALHQHLITRAKNPLTSEEAIQQASESFVNYDIPMHRMMTYSDDMGFTLFSKYFLRVQRVIFRLAQEHPGNVLATMLMTNYLVDLPNVLESSPLNRLGNNPFNAGAFGYPGALDELATVNAGLSLLK